MVSFSDTFLCKVAENTALFFITLFHTGSILRQNRRKQILIEKLHVKYDDFSK